MLRLQDIYLFKRYSNVAEAFHDGVFISTYDPEKPLKYWADLEALKSPRKYVVYDYALAVEDNPVAAPLLDANNRPYLEQLILEKEDAASVNIPPSDVSNFPRLDAAEIQVPCRPLKEGEYLDRVGWGAPVMVVTAADKVPTDRQLLESISNDLRTVISQLAMLRIQK